MSQLWVVIICIILPKSVLDFPTLWLEEEEPHHFKGLGIYSSVNKFSMKSISDAYIRCGVTRHSLCVYVVFCLFFICEKTTTIIL